MSEVLAQLEKKGGKGGDFATIGTTTATYLRVLVSEMYDNALRGKVAEANGINFDGNIISVSPVSTTVFRITYKVNCTLHIFNNDIETVINYNANDTETRSGGGILYVILPR